MKVKCLPVLILLVAHFSSKGTLAERCCGHLPAEAVSSRQHPLLVDEGTSTHVTIWSLEADLPWPAPCRGILSSNYPATERSCATN